MANDLVNVATLNLWGRKGAFKTRMEMLCKILDEFDFDILCLQEVLAENGNHDVLKHLCEKYSIFIAPTLRRGRTWYGNAVASKSKLSESCTIPLPVPVNSEPRNAIMFTTPSYPEVTFLATHFSNGDRNRSLRLRQCRSILKQIELLSNDRRASSVILGDLNAPKSEYPLHAELEAHGFQDTHQENAKLQAHDFYIRQNINSISRGITEKLDYILARGRGLDLKASGYFGEKPVRRIFVSDHIGLHATFSIHRCKEGLEPPHEAQIGPN